LKLVRHAESMNNEVYRDARALFKGGTEEFDSAGWNAYVDKHRVADPGISQRGHTQANKLAQYLEPHLRNQASQPVQIITSPMQRTLETVMPTLSLLNKQQQNNHKSPVGDFSTATAKPFNVIVNAHYFESEGCHLREITEPGMNQSEIRNVLAPSIDDHSCLNFEGFSDDPAHGWYQDGLGPETRPQSEARADIFYLWLCEHLDNQLESGDDDIFDAGVTLPCEEDENEFDKVCLRKRKRRTAILIGHGDFTNLLMTRIAAGFGHSVENASTTHRSAFVHYNTGITELEYFGKGRFLVMGTNQTPHLNNLNDMNLLSGGGLRDGWSYIMPPDKFILEKEASVAFTDELEDHVREQTCAMKTLYASKGRSNRSLSENASIGDKFSDVTILVKRGLQVAACASFDGKTGHLSDVVIRPSAKGGNAWKALVEEAKMYTAKIQINKLFVKAETDEEKSFYENNGFVVVDEQNHKEMNIISMRWNADPNNVILHQVSDISTKRHRLSHL